MELRRSCVHGMLRRVQSQEGGSLLWALSLWNSGGNEKNGGWRVKGGARERGDGGEGWEVRRRRRRPSLKKSQEVVLIANWSLWWMVCRRTLSVWMCCGKPQELLDPFLSWKLTRFLFLPPRFPTTVSLIFPALAHCSTILGFTRFSPLTTH